MFRVKKYMLLNEEDSEIMVNKYTLRKAHKFYVGGCPQNYCSPSLYKIYNGCNNNLDCKECWDKFLDDIIIIKRNNMEAYNG